MVKSIKTNQNSQMPDDIPPCEWFEHFKDLNKNVNLCTEGFSTEAQIVKDFKMWAADKNYLLDHLISNEEVCRISKKLKNKKACASDALSNEIIKLSVQILPSYFVNLFNLVLSKGAFPSLWSKGYIVPIHKSGNTDDPNNYIRICISSCLGNFFTLIMNTRLNDFLESNKITNKSQIGFRKNCGTADHLLVLKTLIDVYKLKRKPIFACFIDFRKAYDSVWREGLLFKLIINGCSKNFIRIMLSMYSSVNTCTSVKLREGITPFFKSYVGVKQGCNLSPTLFNLFINDIPNMFDSSCAPVNFGDTDLSCLLYADDLVIFSESKSGLQNCLIKLQSYTKRWKLTINLKKSKILLFGTTTQRRTHLTSNWLFENNILEQVDEYQYLGMNIHYTGNFKQAQKTLYNKALRAYHGVFKSFSNIKNIPVKALLKLFSAVISPVLLYNCEIWGPYLLGKVKCFDKFKNKIFNDIEKLHLKFCKRILGVHSKSTNLAVYAELGRTPLILQISTTVAKFWLRINNPSFKDTLVGEAGKICMDLNLQTTSFTKYFLELCNIKVNSLKNFIIPQKELENFCHCLKNILKERFVDYWKDNIQGKLRTFKRLKINFEFKKYIAEIGNIKHRQAITKLRISAHRLPVKQVDIAMFHMMKEYVSIAI